MKKSEGTWGKVYECFKRAETAAEGSKNAKTQEREEARADAVVSQPFADDTHLLVNQVRRWLRSAAASRSEACVNPSTIACGLRTCADSTSRVWP